MRDEDKILDWRSTGRRKARRALFQGHVLYKCVGYKLANGERFHCEKTSKKPPKDAPSWFEEIWPEELRVLDYQLEADHETKDWTNNELENINWKCKSCHRIDDSKSSKGEAQETAQFWLS